MTRILKILNTPRTYQVTASGGPCGENIAAPTWLQLKRDWTSCTQYCVSTPMFRLFVALCVFSVNAYNVAHEGQKKMHFLGAVQGPNEGMGTYGFLFFDH